MFVRDFIEVPRPFEEVAPRLVRDASWLNPIVHDALKQASEVGHSEAPNGSATDGAAPTAVHCIRGRIRIRTDSLVVLVHWDTDPPGGVLPVLDGDLEVAPLSESRSQVSLSACCPPYGRADPATERVVEVAMRAFLERLAPSSTPRREPAPAGFGRGGPAAAPRAYRKLVWAFQAQRLARSDGF